MDSLITTKEACEKYNLKIHRIRYLLRNNMVNGIFHSKKKGWLIYEKSLQRYLSNTDNFNINNKKIEEIIENDNSLEIRRKTKRFDVVNGFKIYTKKIYNKSFIKNIFELNSIEAKESYIEDKSLIIINEDRIIFDNKRNYLFIEGEETLMTHETNEYNLLMLRLIKENKHIYIFSLRNDTEYYYFGKGIVEDYFYCFKNNNRNWKKYLLTSKINILKQ